MARHTDYLVKRFRKTRPRCGSQRESGRAPVGTHTVASPTRRRSVQRTPQAELNPIFGRIRGANRARSRPQKGHGKISLSPANVKAAALFWGGADARATGFALHSATRICRFGPEAPFPLGDCALGARDAPEAIRPVQGAYKCCGMQQRLRKASAARSRGRRLSTSKSL
jgi:hypothetical protein